MLFIGGTRDRERIEVQAGILDISLPIRFAEDLREVKKAAYSFKIEEYKLNIISGSHSRFEVIALASFSGDRVIEYLIKNYNPLPETE